MADWIGIGRRARRCYGFDEVALVPGTVTVNPSEVDTVIQYIENQKQHHSKKSFQDEYRLFLKKYEADYDERYVWD